MKVRQVPARAPKPPGRQLSLEELRDRVTDLVRKNPTKAAIVVTDWLRIDRQRKTG